MRTIWVQGVSKAPLSRHLRWKHAVHSQPACDVFMRELCVVHLWLGQTSVHGNTTNLERVFYLCLALDWRWSDVLLASTLTRGKTLTFLNMRKMCSEVDAHDKWITFIRRSRQFINEFWRTLGESQRTDQNSSFFGALDVRDGILWNSMYDLDFLCFHRAG